jgi:diguanylate cyclase (GGDEF)-like protein
MLRAGAEALVGLRQEFGRAGAIACAGPLLIIGLLFALRAVLLLPLLADHVGAAMVTGGAFNAALGLVTLAMTLLQNLGLGAMVVSRTVSQLQRLSDHDALTGLLNRRGLAAQHERERSRLRRGGGGHALLQIDIDHFKRINDVHGHAAGDLALVAVARTLKAAMRPHDVVARTGGEEFCALLPGVDPALALRVAQRMRESVRGTPINAGSLELAITCSIGVAWTCDADETLERLGRRADNALYHAKAQGRDRVVSATAAA